MTLKASVKDPAECARQKSRRARFLAAGLCKMCGRVAPLPGRTFCKSCRDHSNGVRAARRRAFVASGLCGKCGKNPRDGDKYSCLSCGAANAAKKKRDYIKARDRGRANGLCNQCGNRPRKVGLLRCEQCVTSATIARFKQYGLTREQYAKLGDVCRICDSRRDLVIDHNHETDEVRGILCRKCNAGIGLLRDSPDLLIKAVSYLKAASLLGVAGQIDQPTDDGRATEAQPRYLN